MIRAHFKYLALTISLALWLAPMVSSSGQQGGTPAGLILQIQGFGIYKDDAGVEHRTTSEIISLVVQTIALLYVSPNETEPSLQVQHHQEFTRIFQVCNGGNSADKVIVSRTDISAPARLTGLYFDTDGSGTISSADLEIRVGETPSPDLEPGGCTGVLVRANSEDFPSRTNLPIHLTARTTTTSAANGIQEATGQIVNAVINGPQITGPGSGPPLLLVNSGRETVATANQVLTYNLSLRNSGDSTAQGVVFVDDLPAGLELVSGSLKLDGKTSGSVAAPVNPSATRVEVTVPPLASGQSAQVDFQVRVTPSAPAGRGLVNIGQIAGLNFASINTTETVVLVDPFGIVFAARSGLSAPISGARITLLADTTGNAPVSTSPGAGLPPNTENQNPDIADRAGRYNFRLLPEQLGSAAAVSTYYLRVSADGFMTRMLKVSTSATHSDLFAATITAIDGLAIAGADGFSLVRDPITFQDLGALSPNIPMFETHGLEIDKSVDKQNAVIGDVLTYTINIHNPTSATISDLTLRDTLPESFHYAAGTARMQTTAGSWQMLNPSYAGGDLMMALRDIAPAGRMQLQYRVRIGANAQPGQQFNQAVATGKFPNGDAVQTEPARVPVYVGAGVFSNRQIILGRVYEDLNGNRHFDKGDQPVSGARVYLMNGQYAITDASGLYNFPTLGDGAAVIALDPISLPTGLRLEEGGQLSERGWARLLRTPLGGGALFHQDFALMSLEKVALTKDAPVSANKTKTPALINSSVRLELSQTSVLTNGTNLAPGTYEFAATEKIPPVKPGDILVVSPESNSAAVTSGSAVKVRVAIDWKVILEINGKTVSGKNIGEVRADHANQITTYTFAGLTLPPGPNEISVTAIGPKNEHGRTVALRVMGRGPARRIEIVAERRELSAGGKDSMIATIRALDQWNNPALDGQVALEAINVQIAPVDGAPRETPAVANPFANSPSLDQRINLTRPASNRIEPPKDSVSHLTVALKDGQARIKLSAPGTAAQAHLKVVMLQATGDLDVRVLSEPRPTLMVGLAEAAFGNTPAVEFNGESAKYRGRLAFFFRGALGKKNLLTLSYDSRRALNQTAGQDRVFQLDPLERAYPIFGDTSTRFEEAQSNSKLYARLDRGRSYAMFGDFDADLNGLPLTGYARKLTGVKLHLEDGAGSYVTVTGARPNTAFVRDVIPAGSLSLVQLTFNQILPGSETVTLEVRDRRNPEIILSTEPLIRSVDYNLDPISGQLFLLRYISTFDFSLNLTQIVVTYEHRASGASSMVLTGRVLKKFPGIGLQLGFSGISQRQDQFGDFRLGGFDLAQNLPHGGLLKAATAWSRGMIAGFSNASSFPGAGDAHNGVAYEIDYAQPVSFREGVLHGRWAAASARFFNPFGTTITPGSRRAELSFSFKPRRTSTARVAFTDERNKTDRVDNSRSTFSLAWSEAIRENLKINFGYDLRKFSDQQSDRDITSNLFTLGAEWRPIKKLELTAKREQNFGSSDPSYPNQTTLGATYQVNSWAKLFFTQRLASAPIVPIADTSGFAVANTRSETAVGIETKVSRFTSMTGRYQIENGANSSDSFAVVGLLNRFPVTKKLSLELGYERGIHLKGAGKSFNSVTVGTAWQPNQNFVANARYELRDRNGAGRLFVVGAAGRINQSISALSRLQFARLNNGTERTRSLDGEAALAIRPAANDRLGVLFSYRRESRDSEGPATTARDRADTLSADAFYDVTSRWELSARLAARFVGNDQSNTPYVSTLTYLAQGRAQYRFARRFDFATEMRALFQPQSGTARRSYGAELGFWALPDLRFGLGYNFAKASEPAGSLKGGTRRGFYFNISTKLSRLFDLFSRTRESAPANQSAAIDESKKKP